MLSVNFCKGPVVQGTATLTSTILRVKIGENDDHDEDDDDDDDHGDHKDRKPDTKSTSRAKEKIKYMEINMMGAIEELDTIKDGYKAIKNQDGKITDSDHRFVYKIRGYDSDVGIDLIFNKVKELSYFNQWREALEESKEIVQTKVNRLAEAKRSVIASTGGNLDLQTRFADKTMPERCVSQSRYSFKNRLDSNSTMRRSASVSKLPIISGQQNAPPLKLPIISGQQNAPPLMPRKSETSNSGNYYSNEPTSIPRKESNQPAIPRPAPPIPRKSSPSNKGNL